MKKTLLLQPMLLAAVWAAAPAATESFLIFQDHTEVEDRAKAAPEQQAAAPSPSEQPRPASADGNATAEKPAPISPGTPAADVETAAPKTPTHLTVRFAPKPKSSRGDAYANAQLIYDSSPAATQGAWESQGLVFVIVVIDTRQEDIRHLEGTAMLRSAALLREKYPKLPEKFNVPNRLVEKKLDDRAGLYRYATAWKVADLKKVFSAAGK